MIKVYYRHKGKVSSLHMDYTEDYYKIMRHIDAMFPGASLVRVFLNRGNHD